MKAKKDKTNMPFGQKDFEKKNDLSGYPEYPANEDIYKKCKEEKDIDPEDIFKTKESSDKKLLYNEKDYNNDVTGSDLDIPGAELDDDQEIIGSEDEENNYYSLGGESHSDLEEDKGS